MAAAAAAAVTQGGKAADEAVATGSKSQRRRAASAGSLLALPPTARSSVVAASATAKVLPEGGPPRQSLFVDTSAPGSSATRPVARVPLIDLPDEVPAPKHTSTMINDGGTLGTVVERGESIDRQG